MKAVTNEFKFDSQAVRVVMRDNEPWFVAADICKAVGIVNSRDAIERLDEDEKGVALTDTLGGAQQLNVVSESGMYTLVLRCREATTPGTVAHRFRKWVTSQVLPTIRKAGSYMQGLPHDHVIVSERALSQVLRAAKQITKQFEHFRSSLTFVQHDLADLELPAARLVHAAKFRHLQPSELRAEIVRVLANTAHDGLTWEKLAKKTALLRGGKTGDVLNEMIANGEVARLVLPKTVVLYLHQFAPKIEANQVKEIAA